VLSRRIASVWTGIQQEEMRNVVKRPNGKVLLIAINSNKVDVVHRVVELGLATHLYLDANLADALEKRILAGRRHPGDR
jgi:hypothetical protein